MSERREFVKVERMGDRARYSVTVPIEVDPVHARIDELEQRISDVNDAALYDHSQLEERIDALERRIEAVEWLTDIVKAHSKLFDAILRKLNHKGGNE